MFFLEKAREIEFLSRRQLFNKYYKNNIKILKNTDIFISSYPRSGNTWMRLLLADIILQVHNFPTDTELPIPLGQMIPDIYAHDITKVSSQLNFSFRLIKTHDCYNRRMKDKVIYLFRNPADSLCSFYHYRLRDRISRKKALKIGQELFVHKMKKEWCDNIESHMKAQEKDNKRFFFLSYESLHQETTKSLQATANFLGIKVSEIICENAVLHHGFEKRKAREVLSNKIVNTENTEYFFRKGSINSSKEELKPETISFIERTAKPLYDRAKKLEVSLH